MNSHVEAVLDQKFKESYLQIEKERKRSTVVGNLEVLMIIGIIFVIAATLKYVFWGEGFRVFAPAQHDYTVSALIELPGPQSKLVEDAVLKKGYLSLIEYHKYVEMANDFKMSSEDR